MFWNWGLEGISTATKIRGVVDPPGEHYITKTTRELNEGYPGSLTVHGNIVICQANEEATCTCKFQREFGFSFVGGSHAGEDDVAGARCSTRQGGA